MLCRIADLIVDVPETGGLAPRLEPYKCETEQNPDVVIRESDYRSAAFQGLSYPDYCYMESGGRFYVELLYHSGMMLHASAIAYRGRAYLFSGDSGVGKTTHARLWLSVFGEEAEIINDDKPALRYLDGKWYAYGTPWCGKDGINRNRRLPLAGICFLEQGEENRICELSKQEAFARVVVQTIHKFKKEDKARLMFAHVNRLLADIPMFCLVNRPEAEAAVLNYTTMLQAAEKRGL